MALEDVLLVTIAQRAVIPPRTGRRRSLGRKKWSTGLTDQPASQFTYHIRENTATKF